MNVAISEIAKSMSQADTHCCIYQRAALRVLDVPNPKVISEGVHGSQNTNP